MTRTQTSLSLSMVAGEAHEDGRLAVATCERNWTKWGDGSSAWAHLKVHAEQLRLTLAGSITLATFINLHCRQCNNCRGTTLATTGKSEPYRAIVSARYIYKDQVGLDHQDPNVNPEAVAELRQRIDSYNGMTSEAATDQVQPLERELNELYRLALLAAKTEEDILLMSRAPGDQQAIDQIAAWRREVADIASQYTNLPISR